MIKKTIIDDGKTKVTFSVDDDRPVSLVGDFNQWDPFANPMRRRSNGLRSVAVTVEPGSHIRFRYLTQADSFDYYYDDPHADGTEDNGFGEQNGIVHALATDAP